MIIPIRCFTCNHVIADKWEHFAKACEKEGEGGEDGGEKTQQSAKGKVLDTLGITRVCCRRHFLGHVDMMDRI